MDSRRGGGCAILPGAVSLLGIREDQGTSGTGRDKSFGIKRRANHSGTEEAEGDPEVRYKTRWKGTRKQKRPYAIRKPKGYLVENPGDIVQVDTLDIHPFPAIHFKHFTARDVVSRWDVVAVYPRARSRQAKAFLNQLIKRTPFPIRAIQVDGGSEYKAEFEDACRDLGINLFVLPPRSPKLNGRVERAHRTHLDEFYALREPESDLESLNKALRSWEWVYNNVRPHRSLDNLSPRQYIERHTRS